MAVTRLPLVSQPQGPADAEGVNPLARGLVALPLLSLGGYDPIRNFVPAVDLAVTKTVGRYGRLMRGTTTAAGFNLALGAGFNSLAPVASPYTVMALVRVATTGSRRIFLADFSSDGVNESISMEQQAANTWRFYHADSGGSAVASTGVTVTTGWHWVELGWDGAQLQGRVDGAAMSAAAAVNPRRAGTDLRALRGGAFTSLGFDGDIAFIGIWKRFVPIVERDSIRANPWQLYQPTKRNAVFGVGGGGGKSQSVAFTLEDVAAAVSQTLSHNQSLSGTLDGVAVSISQTAQHSQALSATLDGIAFDAVQVGALSAVGGMGFTLVDMPSTMWWKRKPKAITEEVAKKKIKRVVRAIEQAAQVAQVAQPAAQQREVYQAIAPLLADMPGFDWKQVFRLIVAQDTARRQMEATIARAKQIEQDDEDVLMLLLSH